MHMIIPSILDIYLPQLLISELCIIHSLIKAVKFILNTFFTNLTLTSTEVVVIYSASYNNETYVDRKGFRHKYKKINNI